MRARILALSLLFALALLVGTRAPFAVPEDAVGAHYGGGGGVRAAVPPARLLGWYPERSTAVPRPVLRLRAGRGWPSERHARNLRVGRFARRLRRRAERDGGDCGCSGRIRVLRPPPVFGS